MIFKTLREHLMKKSGGYHLHITEKEFEYIIGAFKNTALIIEFPHSHKRVNGHNYAYPYLCASQTEHYAERVLLLIDRYF